MSVNNTVLNYLQTIEEPKTITEIAAYTGFHAQSVRLALMSMEENGLVTRAGKKGKAIKYAAAHSTKRGTQAIVWKGAAVPISELLYTWAANPETRPKSEYGRIAKQWLISFYILALNSLKEENPEIITHSLMREIRMQVTQQVDRLNSDLATLNSILNNDNLFHPKDLPMSLILKDEEFSAEQLRQIIQELTKEEPK